MRNYLFILLLAVRLFTACTSESPTTLVPENEVTTAVLAFPQEVNLMTLAANGNLPKEEQMRVQQDMVLKKSVSYTGFSLQDIIDKQFDLQHIDTTSATLVFTCVDGYAPTMPLRDALANRGLVAKAMAGDTSWQDSLQQKFAPYYLVWEDADTSVYRFPWPYALVSLQITTAEAQFKDALPPASAGVALGFELFRDHCMKCHSINKVGGIMGPEFNYPKNITEYWDIEHIWAFVQNPQSYRYRSAMPAQTDLKREEFDEIIAYLQVMKGNKL